MHGKDVQLHVGLPPTPMRAQGTGEGPGVGVHHVVAPEVAAAVEGTVTHRAGEGRPWLPPWEH